MNPDSLLRATATCEHPFRQSAFVLAVASVASALAVGIPAVALPAVAGWPVVVDPAHQPALVAVVHGPALASAVHQRAIVSAVHGPALASAALSLGFVGLVARRDPESAIDRLTAKVERIEAGADDVDLSTDRDDAVGRLYAAVDSMATTLRERERSRREMEDARQQLYRITADADLSDDEKIRRLLELGCEQLGVENGHVVSIDERAGRHEIVIACGSDFVQAGSVSDLGEAYCRETIESDGILAIYNAPEEGWADDPAYDKWNIGCYVGGRIEVADGLYGTLCFVNERPREEPFTHEEKAFVDLMTRWLGQAFDRRRHTRELRREKQRLESLVQEVEEYAIFMLDHDGHVRSWNEGAEQIKGYDAGEILGEHFSRFYTEEDRESGVSGRNLDAARERGSIEDEGWRVRADGSRFWANVTITALHDEDGQLHGYAKVTRDMTERRERELALEALQEVARELLGTGSEADVAELVVDAAEDVFDVPGVGVYLLDDESNRLEPAAHTDGLAELCGGVPSVPVGDEESVVWNTFVTGTPTVVDDASAVDWSTLGGGGAEGTVVDGHGADGEAVDGPGAEGSDVGGHGAKGGDLDDVGAEGEAFDGHDVGGGLVVPMGDHGVFVVVAPTGPVDDDTRRMVETLVATTEAALDRLESEANLRERDAELAARNRRLRRQIQINEIIRTVGQSLVGASSREEIESLVCERLVEAEDVAFAWTGALDPSGTALEPRAWAGPDQDYLDAVPLEDVDAVQPDGGGETTEPAVATARTESPTVVTNVVDRLQHEPWRKDALEHDFHSVVSVPLSVDEYVHGVLAVYADEPGTFSDLERDVFAELGETIASSINAVETRRALHADTLVELTLEFGASDAFLGRLARATGARVEYEGLASHSTDGARLFFTTAGAPPEEVQAALADLVSVTAHRLIRASDAECRFEATVSEEVLPARFVRHGARPRSMHATGTELVAVVDVPATTDVREFVEMLRDRYPGVELAGRRDVERATHTRGELVASILDGLTDRQREVLRTAYFAGFFEWPRASTGEDVAELLDVSQPTVNRHLRLAQGQLLDRLFDEELPAPSAGDVPSESVDQTGGDDQAGVRDDG